jgi:hypothetical protein
MRAGPYGPQAVGVLGGGGLQAVGVLSPRLQRGACAEPEATEGVGVLGQRLRRVGRAERNATARMVC